MNEKGNLLILIVLGIMASVVIVPVAMKLFWPVDIIVRIMLVFVIITTVRGYLGNSVMTLLVSGLLIYFLVIKWWYIAASSWIFLTLLSFGFFGVIVWGIGTTMRKG
jgi:hypothetical protein